MDRRNFLTGVVGAGLVTGVFSACTVTGPESAVPAPPGTPTTPAPAPPAPDAGAGGNRVLLAYFSRPGENYYYGDRTTLDVGNTQVIADMIAAAANVDVYRIEAADPYPAGYDETVARNTSEKDADARPGIIQALPDIAGYDTVLLGSPVWSSQAPMIMRTFVDGLDLTGMTIYPFVTFAVSGMSGIDSDYAELCPTATIGEGLAVQGEEAAEAQPDVDAWLGRIGV